MIRYRIKPQNDRFHIERAFLGLWFRPFLGRHRYFKRDQWDHLSFQSPGFANKHEAMLHIEKLLRVRKEKTDCIYLDSNGRPK